MIPLRVSVASPGAGRKPSADPPHRAQRRVSLRVLGGVPSPPVFPVPPARAPRRPSLRAQEIAAHATPQPPLVDAFGRTARDLRLSITDRCNFRCIYCMSPDVRFAPPDRLLTAEEIVLLARVAAGLGGRKVRLTGGEPTLRPDLTAIIAGIRAACPDLHLALITNGWQVTPTRTRAWKAAGLDRVTVSLDSLRRERFARLSRSRATPEDVLASVQACLEAGLTPLKINAVLIRGLNDDEAPDLAAVARRLNVEVRFIEYMPLDAERAWHASRWVSAAETRARIEAHYRLVACPPGDPADTARVYRFADGAPGRVAFIAPLSHPFCDQCTRLRITADGKVRPCLFSTHEWDLMPLLRPGGLPGHALSDDQIAQCLREATWHKPPGHALASPGFRQPDRPMSAIGG